MEDCELVIRTYEGNSTWDILGHDFVSGQSLHYTQVSWRTIARGSVAVGSGAHHWHGVLYPAQLQMSLYLITTTHEKLHCACHKKFVRSFTSK